jgi:hypothetical protein
MTGRFVAMLMLWPMSALAMPALAMPVPGSLGACTAASSVAAEMEQMAARLHGRALGCFQSKDAMELRGTKQTHRLPMEYGFAVEMANRRFSQQDLDNLMSGVRDEWKNSDSLSRATRPDYERRINELIEPEAPGVPRPAAPPKPPVLVSIEQPDDGFQTIVRILRGQVSFDGEFFDTTRLDASAVVLKDAKLIRLSLLRELRSKSDVSAIRQEIVDWAAAVAASP